MMSAPAISTRISTQLRPVPSHFIWLLAALTFCAFLTETRFLPISSVRYNVGAFEAISVILCGAMFTYFGRYSLPVRIHPLTRLISLILLVAALSTLKLPPERQLSGVINLAVLVSLLVFTVTLYNVILLREQHLVYLLRFFAYSATIIAVWVIVAGVRSGGDPYEAGPFRGRGHTGIYMFASLWVILLNICWPTTSRRERWVFYAMLPLIFYCVGVAGRRSVYVALILGIVGLIVGFVVARGGRLKVIVPVLIGLFSLGVVLFVLSDYWGPAAFFKERLLGEGDRSLRGGLAAYMADAEDPRYERNFNVLQRHGALRAVSEHPILGIGWGGFYRSEYSLTGGEMHSTPLRFLAETGIVGLTVYLCFMFRLLWGCLRLWLLTRRSAYHLPALILLVAFSSLSVSWIYNRQITERTFWLLLVIFMSFETFTLRKIRGSRAVGKLRPT